MRNYPIILLLVVLKAIQASFKTVLQCQANKSTILTVTVNNELLVKADQTFEKKISEKVSSIVVSPIESAHVVAITLNGKLYLSKDCGNSFTQAKSNQEFYSEFKFNPTQPETALVIALQKDFTKGSITRKLYLTRDFGGSFTNVKENVNNFDWYADKAIGVPEAMKNRIIVSLSQDKKVIYTDDYFATANDLAINALNYITTKKGIVVLCYYKEYFFLTVNHKGNQMAADALTFSNSVKHFNSVKVFDVLDDSSELGNVYVLSEDSLLEGSLYVSNPNNTNLELSLSKVSMTFDASFKVDFTKLAIPGVYMANIRDDNQTVMTDDFGITWLPLFDNFNKPIRLDGVTDGSPVAKSLEYYNILEPIRVNKLGGFIGSASGRLVVSYDAGQVIDDLISDVSLPYALVVYFEIG